MKKSIVLFITLIFSGFFTDSAFAQTAGANLTLAFPRGNFYANNKTTGFGGSVEAIFLNAKAGVVNYGLGANFSFLTFGSEGREAAFSNTIPDVTVDVDRSYNLMNFHLLMRLATNNTLVRPYADVLLGGSYLYTSTTVRNQYSGEEVTSSTNFDDIAWSYGAGAGVMIKIYSPEDAGSLPVWLDIKMRYLVGTEADYIKKGGVKVDSVNGKVSYDITTSETDILTFNIGVSVPFSLTNL
ncbi:MAG: hypothetical protein AMXMBFR48_29470 [Ignavibacteriales bacterium]|jgi:hypothetical protein